MYVYKTYNNLIIYIISNSLILSIAMAQWEIIVITAQKMETHDYKWNRVM